MSELTSAAVVALKAKGFATGFVTEYLLGFTYGSLIGRSLLFFIISNERSFFSLDNPAGRRRDHCSLTVAATSLCKRALLKTFLQPLSKSTPQSGKKLNELSEQLCPITGQLNG